MVLNDSDWDERQTARGAAFLQSSAWGRFQDQIGHPPQFLSGSGWGCLLVERRTRLGKYWFAPYGPALDSADNLAAALAEIIAQARDAGVDWLRLEPMAAGNDIERLKSGLSQAGARPSAHITNPDLTLVVDLSPPLEDVLAAVSQSTRSFIRKNQRENFISFRSSISPADIPTFTRMLGTVSRRNRVNFYSNGYFQKQAECLMPAGMMFLELALDDGQPVASAIIHDYGETSAYTYAASLPEARRSNASALLLWQVMANAKARGRQRIDLYGIAPEAAPDSHLWAGFSAFKRKFGGHAVEHAGTWDLPLTNKYRLYRRAQTARRLLRRR